MRFQVSQAGGGDGRRTRIELSMSESERREARQAAFFFPVIMIGALGAAIVLGPRRGWLDWRGMVLTGVFLMFVAGIVWMMRRSTFATIACDGEFIETTRPWGGSPPRVRSLNDVVSVRKQVSRGRFLRVKFTSGPGLAIPMVRFPSDARSEACRRFAEALCGMIRARKPEAFVPVRKTSPWPRHGVAATCCAGAAAWVIWVMPKLGPSSALSVAVPLALMASVGLIEGTRRVWEEI